MLRKKTRHGPPVDDPARARFQIGLPEPERLVGLGFRSWMAGYQTGDIACWEYAWTTYARLLGPAQARPALTDLACWVRAIRGAACRRIEVFPAQCAGFCRDECVAISMVAASQHGACPALKACAYALLESSAIDEVVEGATCLGATLRTCDRILSPASICDALAMTGAVPGGRTN
jgi:hypothetical protein